MIFLFQSPHAWRGARQRPHHLAARFAAAGHTVRWVEPRYVKWLLNERRRFFQSRRENPAERIEVAPVTLLNGERFPMIRAINKSRLRRTMTPSLSALGEKRVLWLYNPHEAHLAETVPHDLLIYDIMDEYRGFPWSPPNIVAEESALLARADWVFAGTDALYESKKNQAESRIECILSGVDVDHFRNPDSQRDQHSAAFRMHGQYIQLIGFKSPKDVRMEKFDRLIGYAGVIDLRLDQTLLAATARRHPDWHFMLVGPIMTDVSLLNAIPNIMLTGQADYDSLPALYHLWDCAIIPFHENELTRHINPTKMLEYAAAGLPIVSRALPDVEKFYSDGAFLYRDSESFESCLTRALDPDNPERREKLAASQKWLEGRSWSDIANQMLQRVLTLTPRQR